MELISSIVAGVVANAVYSACRFARNWNVAKAKLKIAERQDFEHALASESLDHLGSYLDKSVGQFLLSEYAQNDTIRERVDLFMTKLQQYVGLEDEVPPRPGKKPLEPKQIGRARVDEEFKLVEESLFSGPIWDGLASLRRLIEVRLRSLAEERKVNLPTRAGAGTMVQGLQRAEVLPSGVTEALLYAIDVANRGIHGVKVRVDERDEAYRQAQFALAKLGLLHAEKQQVPRLPTWLQKAFDEDLSEWEIVKILHEKLDLPELMCRAFVLAMKKTPRREISELLHRSAASISRYLMTVRIQLAKLLVEKNSPESNP